MRLLRAYRSSRGAILLECVLALALLVGGGLTVMMLVDNASNSVQRVRDAQTATDIASSVIAQIEAGILTPEALRGDSDSWFSPAADMKQASSWKSWRIDADLEPTTTEGLSLVVVHVFRDVGPDAPVFSLQHVVRLRGPVADGLGESDPIEALIEQASKR